MGITKDDIQPLFIKSNDAYCTRIRTSKYWMTQTKDIIDLMILVKHINKAL